MYNVSMGWAAGVGILFYVVAGWRLYRGKANGVRWWATIPAICGVVLVVLGLLMSVQWPLTVNPPLNPMFGEPCFILGLLLVTTSVLLFVRGGAIEKYVTSNSARRGDVLASTSPLRKMLMPLSWLMAALGLRLISFGVAILNFDAIGGAPPWEPITGQLGDHPEIENTFFALLYLAPGIALVLLPFALMAGKALNRTTTQKILLGIVGTLLLATGATFTGFSVLNDYTHTGMMRNVCVDPGSHVPVESPDCKAYRYRW